MSQAIARQEQSRGPTLSGTGSIWCTAWSGEVTHNTGSRRMILPAPPQSPWVTMAMSVRPFSMRCLRQDDDSTATSISICGWLRAECGQHRGEQVGIVVGQADLYLALHLRLGEHRDHFIVQAHDPARIVEQPAVVLQNLASAFARRYRAWKNRRETYELLKLDARSLDDIGLERTDVIGAFSLPADRDPSVFLNCLARPNRCRY